jgi:hypothetical protein
MGHGKGSRRQVLREPGTYSHGTGRIGAISKNNTPIVFIINDSCVGIGLRWRQCFGGPLRWHRSKSKKGVGRCSSEFVTCIARIRLDVMTRDELGRGIFSIDMSNPQLRNTSSLTLPCRSISSNSQKHYRPYMILSSIKVRTQL